jgi:hypothetical protein
MKQIALLHQTRVGSELRINPNVQPILYSKRSAPTALFKIPKLWLDTCWIGILWEHFAKAFITDWLRPA